jgi:hypothetical protein
MKESLPQLLTLLVRSCWLKIGGNPAKLAGARRLLRLSFTISAIAESDFSIT